MSIEPFIKCSDIMISLKFYSEILDFKIVIPPDPDRNKISFGQEVF